MANENQAALSVLNAQKNGFVSAAEMNKRQAERKRRELAGLRSIAEELPREIERLTDAILQLRRPGGPDPMAGGRLTALTRTLESQQARLERITEDIANAVSAAEAFEIAADAAENSAQHIRVQIAECLSAMEQ